MQSRFPVILGLASAVFLIALLTGPPSFDATDGAEFAVCGSELQISHAPGYPLFLMILRLVSIVLSPLYGHLRLINCIVGALLIPVSLAAMKKFSLSFRSSVTASVLLITAAPVMAQINSLEVYPVAMLLTLAAIAMRNTELNGYSAGMALFAGHPISLLCTPMMFRVRPTLKTVLTFLIPLTLLLYIPLRAGSCSLAHYGHPVTFEGLVKYFTMYSGRLSVPSLSRLADALSFIGPVSGWVFAATALAAGKFKPARDLPWVLALIFLASYQLPDPAGQLWILLIPLTFRSAEGIDRLMSFSKILGWILAAAVMVSAFNGIMLADRSEDDIAIRWTTDVLSEIPPGSIYRPVAHDTFHAAYATSILGMRKDIILSDPFGNYFELQLQVPAPVQIGERSIHISRAWNREPEFMLQGLIFHPAISNGFQPDWESMDIFRYSGYSPDPMAMDIVAEAWARRMIQTDDSIISDSCYIRAMEFASTELTGRRIADLRNF